MAEIELGCGLIAIGREWGTTPEVPSEEKARQFLETAYDLGIRFYDTAPSYGLSEERLGSFLDSLSPDQRNTVRVATKFGEHWNPDTKEPYVDHSLDALKRSFDRSYQRLGKIAVLQLHKTTPDVLLSGDVEHAFYYALDGDVDEAGASVSDLESANIVLYDGMYTSMQFPYNQSNRTFDSIIQRAGYYGVSLVINRPLQMGLAVKQSESADEKQSATVDAFRFITRRDFNGVVLTGTSNIEHLKENMVAFKEVNL